ncbi:hypothetical protein ACOMHN_051011 [Nucella lapillus]
MSKKVEVQTSLYSIQIDRITVNTTQKESKIFVGIYLRKGLVQALVNVKRPSAAFPPPPSPARVIQRAPVLDV